MADLSADMRAIIDRVEETRQFLGMSRSRFSTACGLRPQTYNNFVGSQQSKPNVALILGLIGAYKRITGGDLDVGWLLTGERSEQGRVPEEAA